MWQAHSLLDLVGGLQVHLRVRLACCFLGSPHHGPGKADRPLTERHECRIVAWMNPWRSPHDCCLALLVSSSQQDMEPMPTHTESGNETVNTQSDLGDRGCQRLGEGLFGYNRSSVKGLHCHLHSTWTTKDNNLPTAPARTARLNTLVCCPLQRKAGVVGMV